MQLTLSDPVKREVSDKHYKQYIRLHGKPLTVQTPNCYIDTGLKMYVKGNMTAALIPLDESTKTTLRWVESFVLQNVDSSKYKPLQLAESMFINVSKWCVHEKVNNDGSCTVLAPGSVMGPGTYSFQLQISHVYAGPHRGGETFSLSLHVQRITHTPKVTTEDNIMSLFDDLVDAPPAPVATSTPKSRTKQRRGRRLNLDEVNGPKHAEKTAQQPVSHIF